MIEWFIYQKYEIIAQLVVEIVWPNNMAMLGKVYR